MKPRFEKKETYLHMLAIVVLKTWIETDPKIFGINGFLRVKIEEPFCESSNILFVPDLCVYDLNELHSIYEVAHTSDLTGYKLLKMQQYFYENDINCKVYEISAEFIMKQTKCPDKIRLIQMI